MIILNDPQLQSNFKMSEFACKCGCNQVKIDLRGIALLQKIRNHYNRPVYILSAYRCPKHNKEVGGVENSQHMLGIAYDIAVNGISPAEVALYADDIGFTGIGVYTHNGNNFTHIDTRKTKAHWND